MELSKFKEILKLGENICVEFKQGRSGFEDDAYQTICAFLNRFGGDLFLKPKEEAFINSCEGLDVKSCLMIGDDYDRDMIGAQSAGLNTLYFNYKKKDNVLNFDEFYNFSELKDIL